MRIVDVLREVVRTFGSNRGRTLLTLLGVMIGAGSIVLLASLLKSGEAALVRLNQGVTDANTIRIRPDEVPQAQQGRTTRPLSEEDGRALSDSPRLHDVGVVAEASREGTARRDGQEKPVRVMGVDPNALSMYRLAVERGRFLTDDDLIHGGRVVIIGHEVYTDLLHSSSQVLGQTLDVDGRSWTIVGVLAHKPVSGHGTGTWMWDRRVLVPRVTFNAEFSSDHAVSSLFLRAGPAPRGSSMGHWMDGLGKAAEGLILRRHLGVKNFRIDDRNDASQEKLILTIVQILLLGTGLLSMFVGGMNIMNIMLVTVSERTHEIGLRRAIGASPASIMFQFLLESAALSLIGGVFGVAGGIALSWLFGLLLTAFLGQWSFVILPWSISAGLGLALITGVAFGLFPAYRAARLDPVEALRSQ